MAYTKQNARVAKVHIDVLYNAAGNPVVVPVDAEMVVRFVNDSDANDVSSLAPVSLAFNLLDPALTSTNITAATRTVTYPQLAALIRQACLDRANA